MNENTAKKILLWLIGGIPLHWALAFETGPMVRLSGHLIWWAPAVLSLVLMKCTRSWLNGLFLMSGSVAFYIIQLLAFALIPDVPPWWNVTVLFIAFLWLGVAVSYLVTGENRHLRPSRLDEAEEK